MHSELGPPTVDDAPFGAALPFKKSDPLEPGWLDFNGQVVLRKDYPELWELLHSADPRAVEIWNIWGGSIDPKCIRLPLMDSKAVQEAIFGAVFENTDELRMAIKAKP